MSSKTDTAGYEVLPPKADSIVASMRAIGYDLPMAIADIIDNSIYAKAKIIKIDFDWSDGHPWVRITDDGVGMTEEILREAMRLGSTGPNELRDPDDLGRFGLGLKTASFSQCRLLTVKSKTKGGSEACRCWNLDVINSTKEWKLSLDPPKGSEEIMNFDGMDSGTIVLWQNLDKILDVGQDQDNVRQSFLGKFNQVGKHLEMIFHRYLSGANRIKIFIGRVPLKPWDPFLLGNQFTQELSNEKYEDGAVTIIPYVLPHVSNRSTSETITGSGIKGWNAQQGFYIYRNKRMIVSGGYLDLNLKPEEHYKLARIMVDIKNNMDSDWHIDVRKAVAIPPDRLRGELEKVAKATREEAVKVYRARMGGRGKRVAHQKGNDVWVKRRRGDKIIYEINRDNEAIRQILEELSPSDSWTRKLFNTIERTIPHREIILDSSGCEDCHVDLPLDADPPEQGLISICILLFRKYRGEKRTFEEASELVLSLEPFNTHPAFRAALDKIKEEEN